MNSVFISYDADGYLVYNSADKYYRTFQIEKEDGSIELRTEFLTLSSYNGQSYINGQAIKLTTAKIFWPKSDTCIHGVGIGTVEENRIAPSRDNLPYTHQKDNELLRAVEILRK